MPEQLISHIGVKSNRKVVDLTAERHGTAETLVEVIAYLMFSYWLDIVLAIGELLVI